MAAVSSLSKRNRKIDTICTAAVTATAAAVYCLTMSDCVFPGESASLLAGKLGLSPAGLPAHPLWSGLSALLASLTDSVRLFNFVSVLCGVASAWMVSSLMIFYVRRCCDDEAAAAYTGAVARTAGVGAGLAFIFSSPVWESSTHLGYRMFDILCILCVFKIAAFLARHPRFAVQLSAAAGVATGAALAETPATLPMVPLFLLAIAATARRSSADDESRTKTLPSLFAFIVCMTAAFAAIFFIVAAGYAGTAEAAEQGIHSTGAAAAKMAVAMRNEMQAWIPQKGWMWLMIFGTFPFAACAFSSMTAFGANRHRPSQLLFHLAMTGCAVLAVAPSDFSVRPLVIMRSLGRPPAMLYACLAAVSGYLLAYWLLIARGPEREAPDDGEPSMFRKFPRALAICAGSVLAFVLSVSAALDAISISSDRGAFADKCAQTLIDAMGRREWLVTRGGHFDDHIRLVARMRGRPLHIVRLDKTNEKSYRDSLAEEAKAAGLPEAAVNAIPAGVAAFLSTWLENDPDADSKIAVFDIPDLWYESGAGTGYKPVPDTIFFGGRKAAGNSAANDREDALARKQRFLEAWKDLEPYLPPVETDDGQTAKTYKTYEEFMRADMRRHLGFVANNTAIYLQENGLDDDAFEMFTLVNREIDPDNISALFNLFEMSLPAYKYRTDRPGVSNPAIRRNAEYRRKLDEFVEKARTDARIRYGLWALSNTYGYINSVPAALQQGYRWARSGQPRSAIAQIRKGLPLLPPKQQAELFNSIAMIYADIGDVGGSEATYLGALEKDATNRRALRGLALLSLKKGDTDKALEYLSRIEQDEAADNSLESVFICLANKDLAGARVKLQHLSGKYPEDPQFLGLLCGVIVHQASEEKALAAAGGKDAKAHTETATSYLREAEEVVLPKLRALAERPRNPAVFEYRFARGMVFANKGREFMKHARDEFFRAYVARRHVYGIADIVLNLDLLLNDAENAEFHARFVLAGNNHHQFANYVLGSVALHNGDIATAEPFLREAAAQPSKLPQAYNDLAETCRRAGKLKDAEKFAREAIAADPSLYVAYETLASTILDAHGDAKEARSLAEKARRLCRETTGQDDPRMGITLVRAQFECGDYTRARGGLREVKSAASGMTVYEREQLSKLEDAILKKAKRK